MPTVAAVTVAQDRTVLTQYHGVRSQLANYGDQSGAIASCESPRSRHKRDDFLTVLAPGRTPERGPVAEHVADAYATIGRLVAH